MGNYRELHGFLGYGWRHDPGTQFHTDTHDCVELTPELLVAGRVLVEAYISSNPRPTIHRIADDDPERLARHPQHEALAQLVAYHHEKTRLWEALSQAKCDAIVKHNVRGHASPLLDSIDVVRYENARDRMLDVYQSIHVGEVAKLKAAVDRVLAVRRASM